jgi:cation diffusion facilitator family transporter
LHGEREKRLAALASIGTALVLVALKVFLVIRTGSLGVLSEALHSSLDLVAAVVTYLTVRVSAKPPDADHPYGHEKVESFSAFVQTGLLLLTALYIIFEAMERLFFSAPIMRPSLFAIALLAVMVALDVIRSRALLRVAQKFSSDALEADALHFSTDVWSTTVVMAGMAAAWAGDRFSIPWLRYTDPLAALLVAAVIIRVGSSLGKRTLDALLDVAPPALRERIHEAVDSTEGVLRTERVRMRRAGARYFVDVTIGVPRGASLEQAHATSDAVERRIAEMVPADVVVHMEPRAPQGENLFEAIRAVAQKRGLAVHELSAHQLEGRLFVELHLEVPEHSTLKRAHRLASQLEGDILAAIGTVSTVNIHIEPQGAEIAGASEMRDLARAVQEFIASLHDEYGEIADCHDLHVRSAEHKILASCHCTMDGGLPINQVHDITAAVEDRVKERFPQIFRVTIHPEPVEES